MVSHTIVPLDGIVEVTIEGTLDLQGGLDILLDITQSASTAGRHILFDLRKMRGALTFRDIYQLVQGLTEHPTSFRGRIALLDKYDEGLEKAQFFEASATEYGFDVRTFIDADSASQWLRSAPDA